jgi:hypothetical protein
VQSDAISKQLKPNSMKNVSEFIVRESTFSTFMDAWNYCKNNDISTRVIYERKNGEIITFNN